MEWKGRDKAEASSDDSAAKAAAVRALVERAQRGDHDAFAELLRLHQRRVFSLVAHLLPRPADVEDIAQEIFLKVYRSLPRFDFRAAFSTWLYRIVVNECYDQMRRQRAQKSPGGKEVQLPEPGDLEQMASSAARAPDVARQAELRQMVAQLFRRLPAHDRLLLTLREVEGLSVEEIGEVMGIKENTVKVQLFRARKRLLELHRRWQSRRKT